MKNYQAMIRAQTIDEYYGKVTLRELYYYPQVYANSKEQALTKIHIMMTNKSVYSYQLLKLYEKETKNETN